MKMNVQKWGNSLAIRIPKIFAEETSMQSGTTVDLSVQDNTIVIKPISKNEITLQELVSRITDANQHHAIDTGAPIGKETW